MLLGWPSGLRGGISRQCIHLANDLKRASIGAGELRPAKLRKTIFEKPHGAMYESVDRLLGLYEAGALTRRDLLRGVVALGGAGAATGREASSRASSAFQARTLNHVTIFASNVAQSKDFYRRLGGLTIRDEGSDYCEFRLRDTFLGLYAPEPNRNVGLDHICFGIERYEPHAALATLKAAMPDSKPTLENGNQVYLRDPDGVRVQVADMSHKL